MSPSDTGGTQWAANADYSVYEWIDDVKTFLTTVDVNQGSAPPNNSPTGADRPWKLLGVWNVTGWIEVDLADGSSTPGDRLVVGDAMVHAIWPTVSIRPTDVTVNPNVATAHAGDYVD